MQQLSNIHLLIGFCTFTFTLVAVIAEEECLSVQQISCYECVSTDDQRCLDHFNTSLSPAEQVPTKPCKGCCVKIVMNKKSAIPYVRRTCTREIQINLFMVDHVCMEESDGQGHMCFCESDNCNHGHLKLSSPLVLIFTLSLFIVIRVTSSY